MVQLASLSSLLKLNHCLFVRPISMKLFVLLLWNSSPLFLALMEQLVSLTMSTGKWQKGVADCFTLNSVFYMNDYSCQRDSLIWSLPFKTRTVAESYQYSVHIQRVVLDLLSKERPENPVGTGNDSQCEGIFSRRNTYRKFRNYLGQIQLKEFSLSSLFSKLIESSTTIIKGCTSYISPLF